jgi:hypothetical protein
MERIPPLVLLRRPRQLCHSLPPILTFEPVTRQYLRDVRQLLQQRDELRSSVRHLPGAGTAVRRRCHSIVRYDRRRLRWTTGGVQPHPQAKDEEGDGGIRWVDVEQGSLRPWIG